MSPSPDPQSNPFATRYTRPGAIEFIFDQARYRADPGVDQRADLVDRFRPIGSQGQILGPHGSGKSTLLAALLPSFREEGWQVAQFTLHDGQRRLPAGSADRRGWNADTIVIVDGYEQLSKVWRWRLRRSCCRQKFRLLITTHADQGLPLVWQTAPHESTLLTIVDQLTAHLPPGWRPTDEDVRSAYAAHNGNLREALFELYDVIQARQPS